MADRLRALLDRPLDPSAARAILVLAGAILLGFATLFILAAGEPDDSDPRTAVQRTSSPAPASPPIVEPEPAPVENHPAHRQDPQDEEGTPAARRADRALRSHRALQHVPYRSGGLRIVLAGARGHRAVLRVSAETVRAAREGWREFLRRFRDSGRAYLPHFRPDDGARPRRGS